jgi:quercetin dioxygenase-like cupin family protein
MKLVSIPEVAAQLHEPFTMVDLAEIDDLVLSVFLCQGNLPRHRHLDQDELFLVYTGTISLETDWGTAILRPGEMAVAPKGLAHRSSSLLKSLVLLLQPRLMVNRRNGDRRLFALKDQKRLEKVGVTAVGRKIAVPFTPIVLADLDTFSFSVTLCQGLGPWWQCEHQQSLVLCCEGQVELETEREQRSLHEWELAVVPKGTAYRLSCAERALVIGLQRHSQPGLPLRD